MIDPVVSNKSDRPGSELDDFMGLVDRYETRITSVVWRFLDDPRDAEEAVQDTFLQAWRHRDEFRSDAAVFSWLYRIATNTALMKLRRRRLHTVGLDELSTRDSSQLAADPLADHPERLNTINNVRLALAELPDHYRVVVILRDVEGHSNAETANLLGLPITTVKAQLHRARSALRNQLHPNQ